MKKLSLLLAILLLLSAILMAACNNPKEPDTTTPAQTTPAQMTPEGTTPEGTTPEETTQPEVDPPVVHASISVEQLAKYEIIYAKNSSAEVVGLTNELPELVLNTFGAMLNRRTDLYYEGVDAYAKGQYEILIGQTNREESETFLADLKWDDYGFGIVGDKLVIAGKNEDGTLLALRAFVEHLGAKEKGGKVFFSNADQLLVQTTYPYPNLTINGISATDLAILCNQEELGGVAQIVRDAIIDACGIAVPIVKDEPLGSVKNKMVIGHTEMIIIDYAPEEIAYPTGKEFYISKLAGRNGDAERLRWSDFRKKDSGFVLCYTPNKTKLSSGRFVAWPIHPDIWKRLSEYHAAGRPFNKRKGWRKNAIRDSQLVVPCARDIYVRLNKELRLLKIFNGPKACYELRKICIDHIYQKYGAEMASSISGDDIRTMMRYYADPSALTIENVRILDML